MARYITSGGSSSRVVPLTPRGQGPGQQGLRVSTSRDGATAVVCVEGDLDLSSVGDLRHSLVSLVDAGASCLVLDLGRVSFLDCAGIRVLVTARDLTASKGGWMRLESVPAGVRRILQLTGTHQLLEPVPDVCSPPRLHLT